MEAVVQLDVRTAYAACTAGCTAAAIGMTYVWRRRRTYSGFGAWVLSAWFGALGSLLVVGRGILPDSLTILASNFFNVGSVLLVMEGLQLFLGVRPRKGRHALLLGALIAALAGFTYVHPSLGIRLFIISTLVGAILLVSAGLVRRHIPSLLGRTLPLLYWICLLLGGLYLLRGLLAILHPPASEDFMLPSALQSSAALATMVAQISVFLGLIVLNGQRVEQELQQALDECKVLRGIIPICAHCKKIRDDRGAWSQVETYIRQHTEAQFSHGICPDCAREHFSQQGSETAIG